MTEEVFTEKERIAFRKLGLEKYIPHRKLEPHEYTLNEIYEYCKAYWSEKEALAILPTLRSIFILSSSKGGELAHTQRSKTESMLDDHERRISSLEQNDTKLENIVSKLIVDTFSTLDYVKKILITRISEGFSVIIIHDSKDSTKVILEVVARKRRFRERFPDIYLEIQPLEIERIGDRRWEAKEIYSRN